RAHECVALYARAALRAATAEEHHVHPEPAAQDDGRREHEPDLAQRRPLRRPLGDLRELGRKEHRPALVAPVLLQRREPPQRRAPVRAGLPRGHRGDRPLLAPCSRPPWPTLSSVFACSICPDFCPDRSSRWCSPTWAPTSSRSRTRVSATTCVRSRRRSTACR